MKFLEPVKDEVLLVTDAIIDHGPFRYKKDDDDTCKFCKLLLQRLQRIYSVTVWHFSSPEEP